MMNSFCVGHNITHSDGTREYVAVEGWNFISPDQLMAMIGAGIIEDFSTGAGRNGDINYHVISMNGPVDKEAFNAVSYEADNFD